MARRISELIENTSIFESTGFSLVKVTKNGKEEFIELPIRSTGVAEFQESLRNEAPKPPVKKELIKKDSKEGRDIGLLQDKLMQVFDATDEDYINALESHNSNFIWRVIVFALDLAWKRIDGSVVDTFEEKKMILQSTCITGAHTDQIFKDVQNLTHIAEKEEDFL